ncbi:beta strand repeat-containing protein [Campylobacter concisus]|uniref:beta strand repeat-containing protein n=1 Tax=Campylobacter concisus TaxID=199 RepID=UPI000D328228|nr:hypothetical protein [Campylobacter concisus]
MPFKNIYNFPIYKIKTILSTINKLEWVKVLQEKSVRALNNVTIEVKDISVEDINQKEKIVIDSSDPKVPITQSDDKDTTTLDQDTNNNQAVTDISISGSGDMGARRGDGVSLSSASFAESGHICNINASVGSTHVMTTVVAAGVRDNTLGVSGGNSVSVVATGPTLPSGSIKIPLSAYMNNDISGGFVSHMLSLVNDMLNAGSTLNGYKLVRWHDGRDYFVPNAGVNKFTFQDGWFKSNNGLLAIGQDNAKDLVLTSSARSSNFAGGIAKILNPLSDLSVFGGDNRSKIISDLTNVDTKIYSSLNGNDVNITYDITGSGSFERDPLTQEYISGKSYIGTGLGSDNLNIDHGVNIINTMISTGAGKDHVNFKGINTNQVNFRGSILMAGADDDEINIENTLLGADGARVSEIKAGDGNDIIMTKNLNISGGSTISGGDGNDTITINGGDEAYLNTDSVISGGAGNDEIYIKDGTKASSSLILGDGENTQKPGNDKITISGDNTVLDNVKIDAGDGDVTDTVNGPKDIININGGKIITSGVISGNGNDEITINGNTIMEGGYIDSGSGNDKINIAGKTSMDGGYHRTGSGEDIVTITDNANLSRVILDGEEDNDTINITGNAKVKNSFIGAGAGADDKINISGNAEIDTATLKLGTSAYNGGKATDKTTLNVTGDAVLNDVHIGADESLGEQYMNFHQNGEAKISKIDGSNNKDIIDIKGGNFTITDAFPDGKIYGNGGDDEIKIRDGATAKIKADMGDGVDTLTVSNATLKDSTVDMGNGNDIVNINTGATIDNVSINTGAGEDTIKIKGKSTANEDRIVFKRSTLYTDESSPAGFNGNDGDSVTISNAIFMKDDNGIGSNIVTGGGNDVITIKDGTIFQDFSYIAAGNGKDTITLESGAKFNQANVYADAGDDIINVNGAEFKGDNVYNHNAGIHGGAGGDQIFVNSGKFDNARIEGDTGNDTIHIKSGARFENSSIYGDSLLGETGNDTIVVEKGATLINTTIDGGAGNKDRLKIADDSVDLTKVKNFEILDLTEGNHNINLSARDVLDMTDSNNKLRIDGDNGDNVTLQGWLKDTNPTSDGYTVYTKVEGSHTVTLEIKDVVVHEI